MNLLTRERSTLMLFVLESIHLLPAAGETNLGNFPGTKVDFLSVRLESWHRQLPAALSYSPKMLPAFFEFQ